MILWTILPRRTLGRIQKPISVPHNKYYVEAKTPLSKKRATYSLNKKLSSNICTRDRTAKRKQVQQQLDGGSKQQEEGR
jgi:hypothetical protein